MYFKMIKMQITTRYSYLYVSYISRNTFDWKTIKKESCKCIFQIYIGYAFILHSFSCLVVLPRANQISLESMLAHVYKSAPWLTLSRSLPNKSISIVILLREEEEEKSLMYEHDTKFCTAISVTGVREILSWTIRKSGSLFCKEIRPNFPVEITADKIKAFLLLRTHAMGIQLITNKLVRALRNRAMGDWA